MSDHPHTPNTASLASDLCALADECEQDNPDKLTLTQAANEIERLSAIVAAVDAWCDRRLISDGFLAREVRDIIHPEDNR